MAHDAQLVDRLAAVLARQPGVRLALLFGSRARGDGGAHADADLAIGGAGIDRLALAHELGAATGLEVHLVDLAAASYPLLLALLRDGVVVHEGEPHAAASFRTRAILETETDRPWFERMRDAHLHHLATHRDG